MQIEVVEASPSGEVITSTVRPLIGSWLWQLFEDFSAVEIKMTLDNGWVRTYRKVDPT